jgi:hypothetical protein
VSSNRREQPGEQVSTESQAAGGDVSRYTVQGFGEVILVTVDSSSFFHPSPFSLPEPRQEE